MARGRRPTDVVRHDVLTAAGELVLEHGLGGFTIDGVAKRSGASKVTIYKLWPSAGTLALEGYFTAVEQTLHFPDTGDVEADLRAQLHSFVELLLGTSAGRTVAELIGRAQVDPDLMSAYLQRYSTPRRALAAARLERARDQGQLRADLDVQAVVDQLWGACYHRLLLPEPPLDRELVDAMVDNLFRGVTG